MQSDRMKLRVDDGPRARRQGRRPVVATAVLFLALGLAGASLPLTAQEGVEDAAADETDAEAQEASRTAESPTGDAADPILEDYEASEQISEDLSVSFPVDI